MTVADKSALRVLLRGLAWLLLIVAGAAFWIGGRAISEFGRVDRILAEFLGLSLAGISGLFGYILKEKADDLEEGNDS